MKTKNLFPCLGVASARSRLLPALIALLNLIPAGPMTAQTFTTLHSFTATPFNTNSDGDAPLGGLLLSGNTLYGTALVGGSYWNRQSLREQIIARVTGGDFHLIGFASQADDVVSQNNFSFGHSSE